MTETPKGGGALNSIGAMAVVGTGLEWATNGKVTSTLIAVKDAVAGVLSGGKLPSLVKVAPVVGKLAPLAGLGAGIYYGHKKYKDIKTETGSAMKGLYRGIERGTMVFGVPMFLLGSAGLLSVPIAPTILITGLTLKGVRHGHKLLMNSISTLKKTPSYLSSLPKKALGKVKNPFRKKGSSSPSATPPATT